jgi:hypothetical protein
MPHTRTPAPHTQAVPPPARAPAYAGQGPDTSEPDPQWGNCAGKPPNTKSYAQSLIKDLGSGRRRGRPAKKRRSAAAKKVASLCLPSSSRRRSFAASAAFAAFNTSARACLASMHCLQCLCLANEFGFTPNLSTGRPSWHVWHLTSAEAALLAALFRSASERAFSSLSHFCEKALFAPIYLCDEFRPSDCNPSEILHLLLISSICP